MTGLACGTILPRVSDSLLKAREKEDIAVEAAEQTKRDVQQQNKPLKAKEKENRRVKRERKVEVAAIAKAEERAHIDARKAAREAAKAHRDAETSVQLPKHSKS